LFSKHFELKLVGAVSQDVLESIQNAGLSDFLVTQGYVSHQKAIQIQKSSQVLLLIEIDSKDTKCIIPGKLFEYMVSKRPILAIGPKDADIAKLIEETSSGSFFEYTEKESIKKQLQRWFTKYQEGNLESDVKDIKKYSRRSLTQAMSAIIKEIAP